MDVLSEVLKVVTLEGAMFYNAEFSAPWGVREPPACDMAPYLSTAGGHVIIFHLVTTRQEFDDSRFAADQLRYEKRQEAKLRAKAKALGFQLIPADHPGMVP